MKNKTLIFLSLISSATFAQNQGEVHYLKETKFDLSKAIGLPKGLTGMNIKAPSGKKESVIVTYSSDKRLITTKQVESGNRRVIMARPQNQVLVDVSTSKAQEFGTLMDISFAMDSEIASSNLLSIQNKTDEVNDQTCQLASIKSPSQDRDISVCFVPDEQLQISPTAWLSSVPGKVLKVVDGSVTYTYQGEAQKSVDTSSLSIGDEYEFISKVQYQDLQDEYMEEVKATLPQRFKSVDGKEVKVHTITINEG